MKHAVLHKLKLFININVLSYIVYGNFTNIYNTLFIISYILIFNSDQVITHILKTFSY
jgi:hypothetical protein